MISGIKSAINTAKKRWHKRESRGHSGQNVRILPDPMRQSREHTPSLTLDFKPLSKRTTQTTESPQPASAQLHSPETPKSPDIDFNEPFEDLSHPDSAPDEEASDRTEDTDSGIDLSDSEPDKPISDRSKDRTYHPLKLFGFNVNQLVTNHQKKKASITIIDKLKIHLRELKLGAQNLQQTAIVQQIAFIEDAFTTGSSEVVLKHIEQSSLKSLGEYQAALAYLIHSKGLKTPAPSLAHATPTAPKKNIDEILRSTLKTYQNNRVNILVGDIATLKDVHRLPVDAIVCPFSQPSAEPSKARDRILAAEPTLQEERYTQALGQLEGGTAAISPTTHLQSQGVRHIIHQIMPRSGEGDEAVRLGMSYISAIDRAREKGHKSIAIPVTNPGVEPEIACQIALDATLYCQKQPKTGPNTPKVYFVFPNDKNNRNMYRAMDAQLMTSQLKTKPLPPEQSTLFSTSIEGLPKINMTPEDTLQLMGKILPTRHGFHPKITYRSKVLWVNSEIRKVCTLMSQGECPLSRVDKISQYVEKAYSRMQSMALNDRLSLEQYMGLKEHFDQQLHLLEIFERKQDRVQTRRRAALQAPHYAAESEFPKCSVSIKQAMMNDFNNYCSPVLQRHYLKPMPGKNGIVFELPAGEVPRPYHGVQSAARTAIWVKVLIHLYQRHGDEQAAKIREEDIPLIQMAAIYEASARKDGGPNLWEYESAEACLHGLMQKGVDLETAQRIAACIQGKKESFSENKHILNKILHDAVALDNIRKQRTFNLEALDFSRQFQDGTAVKDIKAVANEIRDSIHRQHDLNFDTSLQHRKTNISQHSVEPSFNINIKREWERAQRPYIDIEEDIEINSPFLGHLLVKE